MNAMAKNENRFRRLKRSALIGYVATFTWYGGFGGYLSLRDGEAFGWFAIVVAICLLVLPFTGAFRGIVDAIASHRAFPSLIFLPNIFLVIMYGSFASSYLRDPYLTYNDMDTLAAVLSGGAAVLAAIALIANTVSYILDVRSGLG
jgi:hypothetical protein